MLETVSLMGAGFIHALSPINLIAMFVSTALGITIGCLPGLSAAMGVALLLPITFGMDPATGLIVLGGIYCGAIFGGSISAILIHTPGTPASAATAIEGYQLTLRGQAARALSVACFASFAGGLLSCLSLYFLSPVLAELAMQFKEVLLKSFRKGDYDEAIESRNRNYVEAGESWTALFPQRKIYRTTIEKNAFFPWLGWRRRGG